MPDCIVCVGELVCDVRFFLDLSEAHLYAMHFVAITVRIGYLLAVFPNPLPNPHESERK